LYFFSTASFNGGESLNVLKEKLMNQTSLGVKIKGKKVAARRTLKLVG